jgi:hypothetical protein
VPSTAPPDRSSSPSKLACTLDPAAIKDKAGSGAECSYEAPNWRLKIHAFPPGNGGNCRHLN